MPSWIAVAGALGAAAGRAVIVNVTRAIVADAEARYPGLRVCVIAASAAVRAERLRRRGRESAGAMEARLGRAVSLPVCARNVLEIDNDGALDASVAVLVGTILDCQADGQIAAPVPASG